MANSKKISTTLNNYRYNKELDDDEDDYYNINNYENSDLSQKYRTKNINDNYLPRKTYSTKKKKLPSANQIIVTEDSYILNNNEGKKNKIK